MLLELSLVCFGAVLGAVCFAVFVQSGDGQRGYVGIQRDEEQPERCMGRLEEPEEDTSTNPLISSPLRQESAGEHWRRLVVEVERMRAVGVLDDRQADAAKNKITGLRSGGLVSVPASSAAHISVVLPRHDDEVGDAATAHTHTGEETAVQPEACSDEEHNTGAQALVIPEGCSRFSVLHPAIVRAGPSTASRQLGSLVEGAVVSGVEERRDPKGPMRRVRCVRPRGSRWATGDWREGWVSLVTLDGETLLSRLPAATLSPRPIAELGRSDGEGNNSSQTEATQEEGWIEKRDVVSGLAYWYHPARDERRWGRPSATSSSRAAVEESESVAVSAAMDEHLTLEASADAVDAGYEGGASSSMDFRNSAAILQASKQIANRDILPSPRAMALAKHMSPQSVGERLEPPSARREDEPGNRLPEPAAEAHTAASAMQVLNSAPVPGPAPGFAPELMSQPGEHEHELEPDDLQPHELGLKERQPKNTLAVDPALGPGLAPEAKPEVDLNSAVRS